MQRLVVALAQDAVDGVAVWRSVAFAALEAVLARADPATADEWLSLLARRGLLASFVDGLARADVLTAERGATARTFEQLLLSPEPYADTLAALYAYESRMSFLLRLATRPATAALLVRLGVVQQLAAATFVDQVRANSGARLAPVTPLPRSARPSSMPTSGCSTCPAAFAPTPPQPRPRSRQRPPPPSSRSVCANGARDCCSPPSSCWSPFWRRPTRPTAATRSRERPPRRIV